MLYSCVAVDRPNTFWSVNAPIRELLLQGDNGRKSDYLQFFWRDDPSVIHLTEKIESTWVRILHRRDALISHPSPILTVELGFNVESVCKPLGSCCSVLFVFSRDHNRTSQCQVREARLMNPPSDDKHSRGVYS